MSGSGIPSYRLLEKAEIARVPGGGRELLDAGTEIIYLGRPGPHMEPLNDAARAQFAAAGAAAMTLDPTARLDLALVPVQPSGAPVEAPPPALVFVGANGKPLTGAALAKAQAAYAAGGSSAEEPLPPPPPPPTGA